MDSKREWPIVDAALTLRVLSKYEGSHGLIRRANVPCEMFNEVEPAMSAIDVLECDCGKWDDACPPPVFAAAALAFAEALEKMIERFFTGHRVRTSSTTLTNAARYGTDVDVTLNLS